MLEAVSEMLTVLQTLRWPVRVFYASQSAAELAASVGALTSSAFVALKPSSLRLAGTAQLVRAACMFGNSVTLPLVFLSALLPAAEAGRAAG